MKINDVIRTRRQTLGLTQERLAGKLGVSAPAVNKWEKGLNYPDITILPALARTLGVDLNTLLSFQEDMSREEIGQFLNELTQTAHSMGCEAAFALAREKLWAFPNNDQLAFSVAGILEGVLTLFPAEEEQKAWREEISALYERSVRSADPKVQEWAAYTLAARCIANGELERGEELLETLSDTHRGKQALTACLREKQGQRGEAWTLMEQELFNLAHSIQSVLARMLDLALKEGDQEQAQSLAEKAAEAGEALDLADYAALAAPLQLALEQHNAPAALELMKRLLRSMTKPWDRKASPLYRHLRVKGEAQSLLLQPFLEQLQTDPQCEFLRETEGYQALLEQYQAFTKQPAPTQPAGTPAPGGR